MFAQEGPPHVVLRLGAFVGTKAKREQFVIIRSATHPAVFTLLSRVHACTPPHELLFPYSYWCYRKILSVAEGQAGMNIGFTPHSARAGFASQGISEGIPAAELQEVGRWISTSSFRIYVDVITAAQVSTTLQTSGLTSAIAFASLHLLEYFPTSRLKLELHGAARLEEAARRQLPKTSSSAGQQGPGTLRQSIHNGRQDKAATATAGGRGGRARPASRGPAQLGSPSPKTKAWTPSGIANGSGTGRARARGRGRGRGRPRSASAPRSAQTAA
jgi:hypothetical protein